MISRGNADRSPGQSTRLSTLIRRQQPLVTPPPTTRTTPATNKYKSVKPLYQLKNTAFTMVFIILVILF